MGALRPGELKILTALMTKKTREMTYSELQKKTTLQFNALSDYLKGLQTLGLIERDIRTRKYRIKGKISIESMFFNDVQEFLRNRMDRMLNQGKERAGVIVANALGSLILTENAEMMKRLESETSNSNYRKGLLIISELTARSWEEYILSKFKKDDRTTIETYKRFLLECVKRLSKTENDAQKEKAAFNVAVRIARAKLESAFPRVQIPKKMINLEATRWLKEVRDAQDQILQPFDLDDLKNLSLRTLQSMGDLREDLSEEELAELRSTLSFLENPHHKKTYEKYLEEIRNEPKTVALIASFGFKGYMKKLEELFPEEARKIRQEQKEFWESAWSQLKELD